MHGWLVKQSFSMSTDVFAGEFEAIIPLLHIYILVLKTRGCEPLEIGGADRRRISLSRC